MFSQHRPSARDRFIERERPVAADGLEVRDDMISEARVSSGMEVVPPAESNAELGAARARIRELETALEALEARRRREVGEVGEVERELEQARSEGLAVGHPVSRLRQVEDALRRTEERHRVALREEKQWLEAVMDALPVGVAITDAAGGVLRCNAAYERIWGGRCPPTASVNDYHAFKAWWGDTGEPLAPEEWGSARALRTGEPVTGQLLEIERFDGSRAFVTNGAAPVRDAAGAVIGSAVAIQDVSALRESESKYRSLFENMTEGFALGEPVLDAQGNPVDIRLLEVNEAFERHSGVPATAILARTMRAALPRMSQESIEICSRVARSGQSQRFETYSADLERHFSVYCYRPMPGRFAILFTDVTAARRAQAASAREHEMLTLLFERLPVMITTFDPKLRVFRFNHELRRVLGWTEQDLSERDFMALVYPDPGERARAAEHMVSLAPGWKELCPTAKNGSLVPSSWANIRLSDETRVGIGLDLRERKQAEAALREADARKNDFLATLSHELRNPLAPIKNSLYIIERAAPGGEQALRAQKVIARQVDQLARLVDDLLDITRITRDKIELQRTLIDLNELARQTIEDHRSLLEHAGLSHAFEPSPEPLHVFGDWNRLAQVVGNLLQNAAKFTPKGGHVTISLCGEPSSGRAILRVSDTGVGIAPETLEGLFQPFVQAQKTLDRSRGGLGLGLALVKGLVELHGGAVTAASPGLGRGSTITVRLPLSVAAPVERRRREHRISSARRRVLVIEDNLDAAESLRELLELHAHEVELAHTGPEGIARALEFRPHVVFCDIGLPGMSGFEVGRALRAEEALKQTALVALSGYALPEDLKRASDAGFSGHLAKPPTLQALARFLASPER